ncbi:nuclear transport factor 2 family protein [Pseudomonas citronellolis]|uniref:nuclear transport factor 2 family protein n=1 Tax=Pseudomonas citronellolis TaxID=53408 RepID=UPI0023E35C1A|nr:nuclear transport factor 2 family protein [Pseudomonas citronellolis]MDF3931224.1 nuclear transport factor 2 family protein [Pseudomonas citronellolis]
MADTSQEAATAAIRDVVRDYVEGMVFADEARLRSAFHPDSKIIGHYQGTLEWLSLDDFVGAILDTGSVEGDGPPFWDIQALDVTGDSATVKVLDHYLDMRFSDYLALLLIDGRWRIVNKLYYLHP